MHITHAHPTHRAVATGLKVVGFGITAQIGKAKKTMVGVMDREGLAGLNKVCLRTAPLCAGCKARDKPAVAPTIETEKKSVAVIRVLP